MSICRSFSNFIIVDLLRSENYRESKCSINILISTRFESHDVFVKIWRQYGEQFVTDFVFEVFQIDNALVNQMKNAQ